MNPPAPCRCPAANADCRRAGQPMVGRLWQLCAGVDCTAATSAAYRAFWDSVLPSPLAGEGPGVRGPCIHLGADTLELRFCESCRGRVSLKVFRCEHPDHAAQPKTTYRDCRSCGDYAAPLKQEENQP